MHGPVTGARRCEQGQTDDIQCSSCQRHIENDDQLFRCPCRSDCHRQVDNALKVLQTQQPLSNSTTAMELLHRILPMIWFVSYANFHSSESIAASIPTMEQTDFQLNR